MKRLEPIFLMNVYLYLETYNDVMNFIKINKSCAKLACSMHINPVLISSVDIIKYSKMFPLTTLNMNYKIFSCDEYATKSLADLQHFRFVSLNNNFPNDLLDKIDSAEITNVDQIKTQLFESLKVLSIHSLYFPLFLEKFEQLDINKMKFPKMIFLRKCDANMWSNQPIWSDTNKVKIMPALECKLIEETMKKYNTEIILLWGNPKNMDFSIYTKFNNYTENYINSNLDICKPISSNVKFTIHDYATQENIDKINEIIMKSFSQNVSFFMNIQRNLMQQFNTTIGQFNAPISETNGSPNNEIYDALLFDSTQINFNTLDSTFYFQGKNSKVIIGKNLPRKIVLEKVSVCIQYGVLIKNVTEVQLKQYNGSEMYNTQDEIKRTFVGWEDFVFSFESQITTVETPSEKVYDRMNQFPFPFAETIVLDISNNLNISFESCEHIREIKFKNVTNFVTTFGRQNNRIIEKISAEFCKNFVFLDITCKSFNCTNSIIGILETAHIEKFISERSNIHFFGQNFNSILNIKLLQTTITPNKMLCFSNVKTFSISDIENFTFAMNCVEEIEIENSHHINFEGDYSKLSKLSEKFSFALNFCSLPKGLQPSSCKKEEIVISNEKDLTTLFAIIDQNNANVDYINTLKMTTFNPTYFLRNTRVEYLTLESITSNVKDDLYLNFVNLICKKCEVNAVFVKNNINTIHIENSKVTIKKIRELIKTNKQLFFEKCGIFNSDVDITGIAIGELVMQNVDQTFFDKNISITTQHVELIGIVNIKINNMPKFECKNIKLKNCQNIEIMVLSGVDIVVENCDNIVISSIGDITFIQHDSTNVKIEKSQLFKQTVSANLIGGDLFGEFKGTTTGWAGFQHQN
ncbi:hypothetical protein EIN_062670 [Entamoeba invadens IP1]|uniref:hypothetical protein n=1 Tax=Entamoeba invadens IP1 TaxID=370355 RepID=UPI0002C3F6B9|nr:hypothetical protein EIN_062670 [Entamoeba invadens IP1]ELP93572.1 hypothetical protein EIN_062670 [Entamoeba invadens IP1]|eukprot:XP_004260343.1 hypothetical protein EIN_062670 [Entamoeba invadens IP1]